MGLYFKLVGKKVVSCEFEEWCVWFDRTDRTVAKTHVGPWLVSTVFLGMDHRYGQGPPVVFETMLFHSDTGGHDHDCVRYSTWDQAERGHGRMVTRMKRKLREGTDGKAKKEEGQRKA